MTGLIELRRRVVREWDECEIYDQCRVTDCDDKNLDYHGPSILWCGALKWVLEQIDAIENGEQ